MWEGDLVADTVREASLIELIRTIWGFSLTHAHKKSLEKDRSLELNTEAELETEEHELVAVLTVEQVKEEIEEEDEMVGERGNGEIFLETAGMGVLAGCDDEITILSWTWPKSSKKHFLGLHLLKQEPIVVLLVCEFIDNIK